MFVWIRVAGNVSFQPPGDEANRTKSNQIKVNQTKKIAFLRDDDSFSQQKQTKGTKKRLCCLL